MIYFLYMHAVLSICTCVVEDGLKSINVQYSARNHHCQLCLSVVLWFFALVQWKSENKMESVKRSATGAPPGGKVAKMK